MAKQILFLIVDHIMARPIYQVKQLRFIEHITVPQPTADKYNARCEILHLAHKGITEEFVEIFLRDYANI